MFSIRKTPYTRGFILFTCFLLLLTAGVFAEESGRGENENIILYGLFPTSGPLTDQGEAALLACEQAASDINKYLISIGSDIRVVLNMVEMSSEIESAREKLTKLDDAGASAVLTYLSSSQADALLDYSRSHGIVLLATGVSSPTLAIPADNLIRFTPDDTVQAAVAAKLLSERGITYILPLVCKDTRGGSLVNAVSQHIAGDVSMDDGIWYEPDTTSYTDLVAGLDQKVGSLLTSLPPEEIVVYAVTGNEIQSIMTEAADFRYDNLTKVSWIGCEHNALLSELTGTNKPAEYAYARTFTAPALGSAIDAYQNPAYRELQIRSGEGTLDGYYLAMYDATWIAFKALMMNGRADPSSVQEAVLKMAEQHTGIAGDYKMNANGDRYTGVYSVWGLAQGDDGVTWKKVSYAEIRDDSNDPEHIDIIPVSR